jgi:hypothetical protein
MNASASSLKSLIMASQHAEAATLAAKLEEVCLSQKDFLDKVKDFDTIFSEFQSLQFLKEYAFDLLMAYHLENNNKDEDYFDSKEWMDIEDKTIERGTELLNILLYLSESKDAEVTPDIEDFLYEFLLVDEDEFQDEHRIYEDLIAHADLVEESIDSMLEISKRIDDTSAAYELFLPILIFFKDPQVKLPGKEAVSKLPLLQTCILASLLSYYNA